MIRGCIASACLLLAAGIMAAEPAPKAEALIATIRNVGKEGAGNAEAARAWKGLVALGPRALPAILSSMNDDEAVAGNWLQPAFEAIAERAIKDGKLSTEPLEKILADKRKAGSARALAYAWIIKQDKTAPERLLPGMLTDPSPDLRRLGVEHAVKEADERLARDKADKSGSALSALALYRKAFKAAGDPEQVLSIAETLGKLGEKVDPARQLGLIRHWHLITPFDNSQMAGFTRAYPPEKGVDLSATYKGKGGKQAAWVARTTTDKPGADINRIGAMDLTKALGPFKGTVAYAHAAIDVPEARTVELRPASINALKVFVNGKEAFSCEECHHGSRIDQYSVRVALNKGKNDILLKVCQNEQTEPWAQLWNFRVRICDPVGRGIAFTQKGANKEPK